MKLFNNIKNYFFVQKDNGFITLYQSGDDIYMLTSSMQKQTTNQTIALATALKDLNATDNSITLANSVQNNSNTIVNYTEEGDNE